MLTPLVLCLGTPGLGWLFAAHFSLLFAVDCALHTARHAARALRDLRAGTVEAIDLLLSWPLFFLGAPFLSSLPKSILGTRGMLWELHATNDEIEANGDGGPATAADDSESGGLRAGVTRSLSKRAASMRRLADGKEAHGKERSPQTSLGVRTDLLSLPGSLILAERAALATLGWWLLCDATPVSSPGLTTTLASPCSVSATCACTCIASLSLMSEPLCLQDGDMYLSPHQLAPTALYALVGGGAAACLARLALLLLLQVKPAKFDAPYRAHILLCRPRESQML